jgi:hypothetical protein
VNAELLPDEGDGAWTGWLPEHDGQLLRYQALTARRLQWDALLWQVPVLSLTAQAFLFTVALSGGNSRTARGIASALGVIAAVMSLQLMISDRRSEITDAHWIRDLEAHLFGEEKVVHGGVYKERRDRTDASLHFPWQPFLAVKSSDLWIWGLTLFGLAALATFVLNLIRPSLF